MFDTDLSALDAVAAVDHAVACRAIAEQAEVELLATAAHYADLHAALEGPAARAAETGRVLPGAEQLMRLGGPGTPEVAEFAPAELGGALGVSDGAAAALIGDALDLRHRLPLLWARIKAGHVRTWLGRKVAQATRSHPASTAAFVDARVTPWAERLSWGRLEAIVLAAIAAADPEQAAVDAEAAATGVGVFRTRSTEHGIVTTIVKNHAPDALRFDAAVARVASGLAVLGDARDHNTRRAAAVGILADPELTLDVYEQAAHAAAAAPEQANRTVILDGGYTDADAPDAPPDPDLDGPTKANRNLAPGARPSCPRHPESPPRQPRTAATLYVHLSDQTLTDPAGVARVEGIGPVIAGQLREWLTHAEVTVKPVIDIPGMAPVDGYEIPARHREAVHLLQPGDVFPYGSNTGRSLDNDHTIAYVRGGHPPGPAEPPDLADPPHPPDLADPPDPPDPPVGQTRIGNLGKLTRRHHRLKTHGGWQVQQPFAGIWIWRSPHGRYYLVDPTGSRRLGDPLAA